MKIKIKKVHYWQLGHSPRLELNAVDGDFSTTLLRMEGNNEMNRKLAEKLKKCLEENIHLIKR